MSLTTALVSLALGMLFGLILQRVQASSPDRIIGTLMLRDLTIMKFMLLATGVGAIGIGVLTMFGLAHLKIKTLSLLGVGLGGIVFGAGFAIGGYCPGTCLVGAAEGRRDALFTILGGFLGALVYALVFPWSKEWLVTPLDFGKVTLASLTGLGPGLVGILFGALLVAASLLVPARPGARKAPGEHPPEAGTGGPAQQAA